MTASSTPFATMHTYLMKGETSGSTTTYTKLVDIKDFPDLGGEPETVDVTTLSDTMRIYATGVQDTGMLTFTANYLSADFTTLKALEGTSTQFAVWIGDNAGTPDGHDGKFSFTGTLTVYKNGGGVNDAQDMTICIAPSTVIGFTAS